MLKKMKINNILSLIILIFASFMVLFPVAWMLSTSLKTMQEMFVTPPRWIPQEITFRAFARIWTDYPFVRFFYNSILIVSTTTIVSLFFSSLAGYGASRFNFKGKSSFLVFLLVTQMFPSVMLLIPFYRVLNILGLINTHLGLIIVYMAFTTPLCSWMMYGYFESIPKELDDAASIDGCSKFRTYWQIVLPLSLPGLAATGIYAFIMSWNEYLFALVLTTDDSMKTVPVGIGSLVGQYRTAWNDLMAVSLVASIPMLIAFFFLSKKLIGGLTAGAVKQ